MREFLRSRVLKRKRKSNHQSDRSSAIHHIPIEFPLLNNAASIDKMHAVHDANVPFKYIVLDPLITKEKMRCIQHEAKMNMRATLKETDLFKIYQTGDLASLYAKTMQKTYPHLLDLRNALYSEEFRSFVEKLIGCRKLTDRVDCAANAYAQGCHLLCHDDVIGTRCVSYIIYLTDPDEPWEEKDGGALELYDIEEASVVVRNGDRKNVQGVPKTVPSATVLPKFNTMAMFAVQPGRSYHAVQEVFTDRSPRLSIQGWFHAETPPEGIIVFGPTRSEDCWHRL